MDLIFDYLERNYSNKKVFLTGHTGFKGAWMLKLFSMLRANVRGYSLEPKTKDDLYVLINGEKLCESTIDDLRNRANLLKEIIDFKPDFIFHLGAQPLVRLSYEIPVDTFEVNTIGTINLLDSVRYLDNPCTVVLITTDKVYSNNEWIFPYRENDRLGGYDPYSASKACAELAISCYRNSFFNPQIYNTHKKSISVARAGNVIGGGDWSKDRLIPDIIKSLSNESVIEIRNPNAVRPWQHVLDPIYGYLILGIKAKEYPVKYSEEYNFGPNFDDTLPVEEIVKLAIKFWGTGNYYYKKSANQPHEAGLLRLDISKAINSLGWRPGWNSTKSIENTISWYKQFIEDPKLIVKKTEDQIESFFSSFQL